MKKSFNAFTLAEVLITLGIIGVVAAMTMPTLMNSTNGAQYKAAYKKALSAISQGVTLNVALDGDSFAEAGAETILPSRMNIVKTTTDGLGYSISSTDANLKNATSGNTTLFFNDGTVFQFITGKTECTMTSTDSSKNTGCKGFLDVNGAKGPNKEVKCDGGGSTATTHGTSCEVSNPTDIYPVIYYDQTIMPNSSAAKAVLYGK